MLSVSMRDHVSDEDLERKGVTDVVSQIAKLKQNRFCHVAQISDENWTKILVKGQQEKQGETVGNNII